MLTHVARYHMPVRVAWFSPLPPVRSGIAAYSAELLPHLHASFVIETYPEERAHEFLWHAQRHPYDLVVYQLGNAPFHDYMWAYMVAHPGLVVLHDARLHHARARQLLQAGRTGDYRREFAFDHPETSVDVAEYAVEGLGGPVYYLWPMLRGVMRVARTVAVHNSFVAQELRDAYPETPIEIIRMGVPSSPPSSNARAAVRDALRVPADAVVFAAFGTVTAEKRIPQILSAFATLAADGHDAYLIIVGDTGSVDDVQSRLDRDGLGDRVRMTGYVDDRAIADYLEAADICLCLRWPTAQETSASWLRCLAARRATVISDLAHLVDIPPDVALRVDLLDEDAALVTTLRRLVRDSSLRDRLAEEGFAYWRANHTLDRMADDYDRVLRAAAARPSPALIDLPAHFTNDYTGLARSIASTFGVDVDVIRE